MISVHLLFSLTQTYIECGSIWRSEQRQAAARTGTGDPETDASLAETSRTSPTELLATSDLHHHFHLHECGVGVHSLVPRHGPKDLRLGTKHYVIGTNIDVPSHMRYSMVKVI